MNNKKNYILLSALALAFSTNAAAVEKFSCDELDDMASSLDKMGARIERTPITEGDANDRGLAEVIKHLYAVAAVENESDLSDNVTALDNAWHDMQTDAFLDSLADVIGSLDRLIKRDCM